MASVPRQPAQPGGQESKEDGIKSNRCLNHSVSQSRLLLLLEIGLDFILFFGAAMKWLEVKEVPRPPQISMDPIFTGRLVFC